MIVFSEKSPQSSVMADFSGKNIVKVPQSLVMTDFSDKQVCKVL